MSQTIRETASNRRVSQDALLTNLTVSDNCVLPCLDDRIKSLITTQINNGVANPYLVKDTVVTRNELFGTAPRLTGGTPTSSSQTYGNGTYNYPTQATTLPAVGLDLITLVPAPGPGLMIIPRIIEVKIPKSNITNPGYVPQITNSSVGNPTFPTQFTGFVSQEPTNALAGTYPIAAPITTSGSGIGAELSVIINPAGTVFSTTVTAAGSGYKTGDTLTIPGALLGAPGPDLIYTLELVEPQPPELTFQLRDKYPVLVEAVSPGFFALPGTNEEVVGPRLVTNPMANFSNLSLPQGWAVFRNDQTAFKILGNDEGLFYDDATAENFSTTTRYQVSQPGLFPPQNLLDIIAVREIEADFSSLPGTTTYAGYNFSPVNQPLTMYMSQPLLPDRGRDFTVRVHYNIVPALD